jgi:hypothetical protein
LYTGCIEVGKPVKMVFTEGITVLKDYTKVGGGWVVDGEVCGSPQENFGYNFVKVAFVWVVEWENVG